MSRSFGGSLLTTRPPILTTPSVIASRPATIRRAVVLPPRAAEHAPLHGRLAGDRARLRRADRARSHAAGPRPLDPPLPDPAPLGCAGAALDDRLALDLRLALQRRQLDARPRHLPGPSRALPLQGRELAAPALRRHPAVQPPAVARRPDARARGRDLGPRVADHPVRGRDLPRRPRVDPERGRG